MKLEGNSGMDVNSFNTELLAESMHSLKSSTHPKSKILWTLTGLRNNPHSLDFFHSSANARKFE